VNHALAVDASLAVKWVLKEEYTEQAQRLWSDSVEARRPVVVPPQCTGEVTSALYQRTRRSDPVYHLSASEAREALRRFLAYPLQTITPPDPYAEAFDFADAQALPSIYDCLYVVFARLLTVELWTADERLITALAGRAPWVHFIGDYPRTT